MRHEWEIQDGPDFKGRMIIEGDPAAPQTIAVHRTFLGRLRDMSDDDDGASICEADYLTEIFRLAEENERLLGKLADIRAGLIAEHVPPAVLEAIASGAKEGGHAAAREAIASYLRGHAEEAIDHAQRAALFWAADHIESGDYVAPEEPGLPRSAVFVTLAQEEPPKKEGQ